MQVGRSSDERLEGSGAGTAVVNLPSYPSLTPTAEVVGNRRSSAARSMVEPSAIPLGTR